MRSVRVGGKVHQETVACLGELDARGRAKASAFVQHFLGERADQLDLFEERSSPELAQVQVDKVRVERGRVFGDVWLAWILWKVLDLDEFCFELLAMGRERVAWAVSFDGTESGLPETECSANLTG